MKTFRLLYTRLCVLPASVSVGRYGDNSSSGPTGSLATTVSTSPGSHWVRAPPPGVTSSVFHTVRALCLIHRQPLHAIHLHSVIRRSNQYLSTRQGNYQLARWRSWWAPRLARSGLLQCSNASGILLCIPGVLFRTFLIFCLVPAPCPPARTPLTTASTSSVVVRLFFVVRVLLLQLRCQSTPPPGDTSPHPRTSEASSCMITCCVTRTMFCRLPLPA